MSLLVFAQKRKTMYRLDYWNESLRGLNNRRGWGEKDAIVTEAEPRSLFHPTREGFQTEETSSVV